MGRRRDHVLLANQGSEKKARQKTYRRERAKEQEEMLVSGDAWRSIE
jgi:hypothetical protein